LCEVLLPDAGSIQEIEVSQLNRRNRRRGKADLTPVFTSADARDTLAQFQTVHLKEWVSVARGVRARWWNAGHILGAASI
jgi:metallo-beta-lactamase family protein